MLVRLDKQVVHRHTVKGLHQAVTAALSPEIALGEEVALSIHPSRLHFFDVDSGKRVAWTPDTATVAPAVVGQAAMDGVAP